ncbi:MAG: hypothetical protein KIT45_13345 [Fimbriimonadia bacterium]|nr:hypothetical protein [Fimbriimonadia bacterium]
MKIDVQMDEPDLPVKEEHPPDLWRVLRVVQDYVKRIGRTIAVGGSAFAFGIAFMIFMGKFITNGFSARGLVDTDFVASAPLSFGILSAGIVAFGNVAVGVLSVGNVSLGLVSLGNVSCGLLLAVGNAALGTIAVGNAATGILAIGNQARGLIAIGQNAKGVIAIGQNAKGALVLARKGEGEHVLDMERQDPKAVQFFLRFFPRLRPAFGMPEPLFRKQALQVFHEEKDADLYDRFLSEDESEAAVQTAAVLGDAMVPQLLEWLNDRQPRVRQCAADALKRIGGQAVAEGLRVLLKRKMGWRDKLRWLGGKTPGREELLFTIAEIADATGDLELLNLLNQKNVATPGQQRSFNLLLRASIGLVNNIRDGQSLELLSTPFTDFIWVMQSAKRPTMHWLPPEPQIIDFLESALDKFDEQASPEGVGALAATFRNTLVAPRWVSGVAAGFSPQWAQFKMGAPEPDWRKSQPVDRLRNALMSALKQLNLQNEIVLTPDQMRVMTELLQMNQEPVLQIALILSSPYWGDAQIHRLLQRKLDQARGWTELTEIIQKVMPGLETRLARLSDRKTLMRAVDETVETQTLLRAADQVQSDIPNEQLLRTQNSE